MKAICLSCAVPAELTDIEQKGQWCLLVNFSFQSYWDKEQAFFLMIIYICFHLFKLWLNRHLLSVTINPQTAVRLLGGWAVSCCKPSGSGLFKQAPKSFCDLYYFEIIFMYSNNLWFNNLYNSNIYLVIVVIFIKRNNGASIIYFHIVEITLFS